MKRIIKFRGRDLERGEQIIYGFGYAELNGKKYIFDAKFGMAYHVAPDSVAQLIGIDINGNEVYEGDFCTCKGSITKNFQATFDHFSHIRDGKIVLEVTQ